MISESPKRILYFFPAEYPYGKSEAIVENEIPVLASRFDKIIVHPLLSRKQNARVMPPNTILLEALNDRDGINPPRIARRNFFFIIKISKNKFTDKFHAL